MCTAAPPNLRASIFSVLRSQAAMGAGCTYGGQNAGVRETKIGVLSK
jgi:hypothetical protein